MHKNIFAHCCSFCRAAAVFALCSELAACCRAALSSAVRVLVLTLLSSTGDEMIHGIISFILLWAQPRLFLLQQSCLLCFWGFHWSAFFWIVIRTGCFINTRKLTKKKKIRKLELLFCFWKYPHPVNASCRRCSTYYKSTEGVTTLLFSLLPFFTPTNQFLTDKHQLIIYTDPH